MAIAADLKANGGLVFESNEIAVDPCCFKHQQVHWQLAMVVLDLQRLLRVAC